MAQSIDGLSETVLAELAAIISQLLSQDNSQRAAAEEALQKNWRDYRPSLLLAGLSQLIQSHPDVQVS